MPCNRIDAKFKEDDNVQSGNRSNIYILVPIYISTFLAENITNQLCWIILFICECLYKADTKNVLL